MSIATINLDGVWHLAESEHGVGDADAFSTDAAGAPQEWLRTTVPGDVHETLIAAGRIPDPRVGLNARTCVWTAERDWWFRRDFTLERQGPGMRVALVLDGIDTYADVFVNRRLVGSTRNMFRRYRFDITDVVASDGRNTLLICIKAVLPTVEARDTAKYFACFYTPRVLARKAQCHFGWDWAPKLPAIGIWQGVRLEVSSKGIVEDVFIRTRTNGELAFRILVDEEVRHHSLDLKRNLGGDPEGAPRKQIDIRIRLGGALVAEASFPLQGRKNLQNVRLRNPRLWWPRGYGDATLYDYEVILRRDSTVLHTYAGRFGIREVELLEEPTAPDQRSFHFRVNGVDVFCTGANWVPADCFPGAAAEGRYRHTLRLVSEGNFNMLRVWGGGIYEKDIFYDLCDEMGIMVWQDMMFACSDIPDDDGDFVTEVTAEVEYQVTRLRRHPSIVYWTGGNEKTGPIGTMKSRGELLTNIIGPGIMRDLDPDTPYRTCSPYSHFDIGNDPRTGDTHTGCWEDAYKAGIERYREFIETKIVAFQSEFGYHGPALMRSTRKYVPADKLWPIGEEWMEHIQDNPYNSLEESYFQVEWEVVTRLFGRPTSAEEFVKYASIFHGELQGEEFAHHRRRQAHNGGSLVWMCNDTWPAGNFSMIDYYGLPKPVYYHTRRMCKPTIVSFARRAHGYELWLTTSLLGRFECQVSIEQRFVNSGGKARIFEGMVAVPAHGSIPVTLIPDSSIGKSPDCYLVVRHEGRSDPDQYIFFPNLWKGVSWPDPLLTVKRGRLENAGGEFVCAVTIHAKDFARCVNVATAEDIPSYLSDNFFDMVPGESRTITVRALTRFDPERLHVDHWLTSWDHAQPQSAEASDAGKADALGAKPTNTDPAARAKK